jgi:serine/threonine protein kinase
MMFRQLAEKDHRHIVKLLATFRINKRYHLVFPLASKNLRTYWQDNPDPRWDREEVLWAFRQMLGITSAIYTIHNFMVAPAAFPKTLYGSHGDIKPENILYFDEMDGNDRVLQVTDFGLGQFRRRHSRFNVDPRTVTSTPTYEPPEMALSSPVSRAYDIWSLGCVFLEFITWILGGHKMLEEFSAARVAVGDDGFLCDDKFYTVSQSMSGTPIAFVRPRVLSWIEHLLEHKKCSKAVQDLLGLIRDDLLVIDAKKRVSSLFLLSRLQKLVERAENDETYLLQPYVEWETGHVGIFVGIQASTRRVSTRSESTRSESTRSEPTRLVHLYSVL